MRDMPPLSCALSASTVLHRGAYSPQRDPQSEERGARSIRSSMLLSCDIKIYTVSLEIRPNEHSLSHGQDTTRSDTPHTARDHRIIRHTAGRSWAHFSRYHDRNLKTATARLQSWRAPPRRPCSRRSRSRRRSLGVRVRDRVRDRLGLVRVRDRVRG